MERGCVVKSLAGRDRDRFYAVLATDENYVYLADGKLHRLAQPKRKNPRHLQKTLVRMDEDTLQADGRLRRALRDRFAENR